mgnify:FL=1
MPKQVYAKRKCGSLLLSFTYYLKALMRLCILLFSVLLLPLAQSGISPRLNRSPVLYKLDTRSAVTTFGTEDPWYKDKPLKKIKRNYSHADLDRQDHLVIRKRNLAGNSGSPKLNSSKYMYGSTMRSFPELFRLEVSFSDDNSQTLSSKHSRTSQDTSRRSDTGKEKTLDSSLNLKNSMSQSTNFQSFRHSSSEGYGEFTSDLSQSSRMHKHSLRDSYRNQPTGSTKTRSRVSVYRSNSRLSNQHSGFKSDDMSRNGISISTSEPGAVTTGSSVTFKRPSETLHTTSSVKKQTLQNLSSNENVSLSTSSLRSFSSSKSSLADASKSKAQSFFSEYSKQSDLNTADSMLRFSHGTLANAPASTANRTRSLPSSTSLDTLHFTLTPGTKLSLSTIHASLSSARSTNAYSSLSKKTSANIVSEGFNHSTPVLSNQTSNDKKGPVPSRSRSSRKSRSTLQQTRKAPEEINGHAHEKYVFANTQSLVLPTDSVGQTFATRSSSNLVTSTFTFKPDSCSRSSLCATTLSFPKSPNVLGPALPESIVPSDESQKKPKNALIAAILFKDSLPWDWVAKQRDTSAQIFKFMPAILLGVMNSTEVFVQTLQLKRYTDEANHSRSMYLAYIPKDMLPVLQMAVRLDTSSFYNNNEGSVGHELAAQVDSSFDMMSYPQTEDEHQTMTSSARNALVGTFSGVGGAVALGLLVWLGHRRYKRNAREDKLKRRDTIESFGDITTARGEHVNIDCTEPHPACSSFYVGDQAVNPNDRYTAFETPDGVVGTIHVGSTQSDMFHSHSSFASNDGRISVSRQPTSSASSDAPIPWRSYHANI